ncbi:hypothetical protein L2Y96_02490 [Luteibacter aegosomaticola]|uniref:hypothetical protein n=1 Tax=Luteibacter aegosomaticola TaxID=2911538 RepID=UPI001FF7F7D7|nr:hypothetical protein [Luteibacter aegosomaticola]UPG90661.1 hypothetical protein L2Y96_02490 [Luteibacter aegosomaticola]
MFRRSLSLAVMAGLLPLGAIASPPDIIETYIRARTEVAPSAARIQDTPTFLAAYLTQPSSPYSDLIASPDDLNEVWWSDYTRRLLGHEGDPEAALALLQKAAGLTKARPGIEVTVTAADAANYRGAEAAAAAIKAGIDLDIYNHALDLNHPHVTAAAGQAVALQMLREQMNRYPADQYESHGVRTDVFVRVMSARSHDEVSEDDDRYLGAILRFAMDLAHTSSDHLPTIYRVARIAASYKDRAGYFGAPLCSGDGPSPNMPTDYATALADHRPLCFKAATDRGVHAWFREELRLEASGLRIHENHHNGWSRLIYWIGVILPLADVVSLLEFTNAAIAGDLVESGGLAAEEGEIVVGRASKLTCGIRKP